MDIAAKQVDVQSLLKNFATSLEENGKSIIGEAARGLARSFDISNSWPELHAVCEQISHLDHIPRADAESILRVVSGVQDLLHLEVLKRLICRFEQGDGPYDMPGVFPNAVSEALDRARQPGWLGETQQRAESRIAQATRPVLDAEGVAHS